MRRAILAVALLCLSVATFAQVTIPSPIVPQQFFDNSGAPCAGCFLYTYSAGTSTPLATYTDSTGTSQNTVPITLDSAGRASIWLGAFSYKFVLQDPNSVTLWTQDNINVFLLLSRNNTWTGTQTWSGAQTFNGNTTFNGTATFAGTISGTSNFSNQGSFSAGQMNDYLKSTINNCSTTTEFARGNGSTATEAVTGCVAIPSNAANLMGTGGSFYANSLAGNGSSSGPGLPVALLAQGSCLANNCWGWGGNLIYEDDGNRTTGMWAHGLEIDIGQQSPSTAYTGGSVGISGLLVTIGGNGSGNVATGYALGVGTQSATKQFGYSLLTQNGASAHGVLLGATASTGTVNSQDITFTGLNTGTPATATISGSSLGDINIDSATGRYLNVRGGGNLGIQEQSTGLGSGGFEVLYGDSTTHGLKASYNGDAFQFVARSPLLQTIYNVASDFTTDGTTNPQTVTGLSWTVPANTAMNIPFSCNLVYSQATAAAAITFSIQSGTVAPTNGIFMGEIWTSTSAASLGNVTGISDTSAHGSSGTPSAFGTKFNAKLNGFLEMPSNASSTLIKILVTTATGADTVTVYRDSYCKLF